MMALKGAFLALIAMAVAGCGSGPHAIDTPPSQAIVSDIEATHQTSPIVTHGQRARDEPNEALPWQPDGRR